MSAGLRFALQFVTVTLIWGATWIVITSQLGKVPPSWSVSYRFLLASALLFGLCLIMKRRLRFDIGSHALFAAMGLLQFVLNFNLVYRAEQHVVSGLVAVVFALLVVPNALLARVFLGQTVTLRFIAGSAVGIAGVALLFAQEFERGLGNRVALGLVLTLGGVLAASAANIVQATERARRHDMFAMLAWSMLYGGLMDAAFAWATVGAPVIDTGWRYLGGLAYLAAFGSAIAFLVYFDMIRAVGPARAAYTSVVIPFVALALTTLFEGYRWTWQAGLGGALVAAGLLIALNTRKS